MPEIHQGRSNGQRHRLTNRSRAAASRGGVDEGQQGTSESPVHSASFTLSALNCAWWTWYTHISCRARFDQSIAFLINPRLATRSPGNHNFIQYATSPWDNNSRTVPFSSASVFLSAAAKALHLSHVASSSMIASSTSRMLLIAENVKTSTSRYHSS